MQEGKSRVSQTPESISRAAPKRLFPKDDPGSSSAAETKRASASQDGICEVPESVVSDMEEGPSPSHLRKVGESCAEVGQGSPVLKHPPCCRPGLASLFHDGFFIQVYLHSLSKTSPLSFSSPPSSLLPPVSIYMCVCVICIVLCVCL